MMQIERAKAFYLPDGSFIKAEVYEGKQKNGMSDPCGWKSLDITLIRPDGKDELLCCIDFDDQSGLKTRVYDRSSAKPEFEKYIGFGPEEKE